MPNYVKIPREIIYDKELGDKRVIIFSFLCARRALDDTVAFSITELCHWSNIKPNYRDGKINQKYYDVLLLLSHYGYFVECPDFESCLHESTNSVKYQQVKLNIEKFDALDSFAIIYFDELQRILDFKGELKNSSIDLARMSSAYMLLLLSYLRVNMNRSPDKPLCCYRHYQKISEDTGLSERYVGRIVEILDAMDIVKFHKMKRTKYKNSNDDVKFSTTPKIFADYRHYTKDVNGVSSVDAKYDYNFEIQKQIELMKIEKVTI